MTGHSVTIVRNEEPQSMKSRNLHKVKQLIIPLRMLISNLYPVVVNGQAMILNVPKTHKLPDDYIILQVAVNYISQRLEMIIQSETYDEVEDGIDVPYIKENPMHLEFDTFCTVPADVLREVQQWQAEKEEAKLKAENSSEKSA